MLPNMGVYMIDQVRDHFKNERKISSLVIARKFKVNIVQAEEIRNRLLLERNLEAKQSMKEFLEKQASRNVMDCMIRGI